MITLEWNEGTENFKATVSTKACAYAIYLAIKCKLENSIDNPTCDCYMSIRDHDGTFLSTDSPTLLPVSTKAKKGKTLLKKSLRVEYKRDRTALYLVRTKPRVDKSYLHGD